MSDMTPPPVPPVPPMPPMPPMAPPMAPPMMDGRPGPASDTSKILAGIGYIVPIIALIAVLIDPYKDEKFVKFHAVQALGLALVLIVSGIVSAVPVLGWIISFVAWIAWVVFAILGMINALQAKYYEVPVLYGFVKSYIGE